MPAMGLVPVSTDYKALRIAPDMHSLTQCSCNPLSAVANAAKPQQHISIPLKIVLISTS